MRCLIIILIVFGRLTSSYINDYELSNGNQQKTPTPSAIQVFGFSGNGIISVEIGTPPQLLKLKLSLEDDSIYVFNESCAYTNFCNQTRALTYFQPSHSTTFFTEHKLFDGSILNRPGPTGFISRDSIKFVSLSFTDDFGVVDRSSFETKADGVIGLGIKPEYLDFQKSYLFHLLQRFQYPKIGIVVLPNRNLSLQNSGLISIGGQLPVGCYNKQRYNYDYTSLKYPYRRWIFTLKSATYDYISPNLQEQSATIRPGQFYTIAPDRFLDAFYDYIRAIQLDSRYNDYYITREDGPPLPNLRFETGGAWLILRPEDYISDMTPYGRMVLLKRKSQDYAGPDVDWIFGDNFLQRYCVLLEYALLNERIGFALSASSHQFLSLILLPFCFILSKVTL